MVTCRVPGDTGTNQPEGSPATISCSRLTPASQVARPVTGSRPTSRFSFAVETTTPPPHGAALVELRPRPRAMTPAPACSSCAALAAGAGSSRSARDREIRPQPVSVTVRPGTGRLGTGLLGTGRLGMVLHSTRRGRTAAWRSFSISDSGDLRAGRSDRVQAGRGEHRADPVDLPGGRRGHFGAGIVQAERRVLGGTEQVEREHVDPFDVPEGRDEPGEGGDVAWVVGPAGDEDETHPED